jgi:hypothetical protein
MKLWSLMKAGSGQRAIVGEGGRILQIIDDVSTCGQERVSGVKLTPIRYPLLPAVCK